MIQSAYINVLSSISEFFVPNIPILMSTVQGIQHLVKTITALSNSLLHSKLGRERL